MKYLSVSLNKVLSFWNLANEKIKNSFINSKCKYKKKETGKFSIQELNDLIENDNFLKKAAEIVKSNLENEKLSVPNLAAQLHTTRVTLYRIIKKKTGRTAVTFIKIIRLIEADYLLKNTDLPVTNISFQVGFKAPSYFSTTYKKEFGIAPILVRSKTKS